MKYPDHPNGIAEIPLTQMKLQMKREALEKMNRQANQMLLEFGTATIQ